MNQESLGNTIILFGLVLVIVGVLVSLLGRFGLPRFPGDIVIERENFTFYFPVATSIVISIVLSFLLNFFLRK